jgi:hypothetical protein
MKRVPKPSLPTGVTPPGAFRSKHEDVIVNNVDDLSDVAHPKDEPRRLSEYKPTNTPLSESEIEMGEARDTEHQGWAPRTTENIGDLVPLPEKPADS